MSIQTLVLKQKSQLAQLLVSLIGFLLCLVAVFTYPDVYKHRLGIDLPIILLGLVMIMSIIPRPKKISFRWSIALWMSLFTYLLGVGLSIVDYGQYTNYIFATYHLHFQPLTSLSAFLLAVWYLAIGRSQIKPEWSMFLLPLILFFYSVAVWLWPFGVMKELVKEGQIVEQSQVLFLLVSLAATIWQLIKFRAKMHPTTLGLMLLFAMGLFVLLGEEISWGQQVLGLPGSAQLMAINVQDESNFHNTWVFAGYISQAYILIGAYGGISWILERFKVVQQKLYPAVVPWFGSLAFLSVTIYNYQQDYHRINESVRYWSEIAELLLTIGFLYMVWRNQQKLSR